MVLSPLKIPFKDIKLYFCESGREQKKQSKKNDRMKRILTNIIIILSLGVGIFLIIRRIRLFSVCHEKLKVQNLSYIIIKRRLR